MCGIAGIMLRQEGQVGDALVRMCDAMRHRGADSTGFALYGEPDPERFVVRLRFPDASQAYAAIDAIISAADGLGAHQHAEVTLDHAAAADRFARLELSAQRVDAGRLARVIEEAAPGVEIQSIGHALEIVKDAGDARTVDARHGISEFVGTHGLGHVRLATESITAVAYGHPFWAEPFPDVAIVHNGQLTNYYTLRRLLRQDGFRFHTGNDSELIAVYLADKMSRGQAFDQALRESVYELDGCFAYLLSMPGVIGSAKDAFAIKSIVVATIAGDVAMATEEQAIRAVYADELDHVVHPDPRSVFVWETSGRVLSQIA